jgi:hypothetical protein
MWSGGIASPFLTSALDGVEWSASRPGRNIPGETARVTHWIGGWVGLRVGLDAMEKRKILPLSETEQRLSSSQLYRLSYPVSLEII